MVVKSVRKVNDLKQIYIPIWMFLYSRINENTFLHRTSRQIACNYPYIWSVFNNFVDLGLVEKKKIPGETKSFKFTEKGLEARKKIDEFFELIGFNKFEDFVDKNDEKI